MKIIEQYDPAGVLAGEIPAGELFVYNGSYYIRTQIPPDMFMTLEKDTWLVAVDLATGELAYVLKTERVPPIYARIRINGRAD